MAIFLVLLFALASALPSVPVLFALNSTLPSVAAQVPPQPHAFVVQWGASVCQAKRCNGTKTPDDFTIGGLVPLVGTGVCNIDLQPNDLTRLMRAQLAIVWPDVYNYGVVNPTSSYFNFWANEWKKNGCFTGLPPARYFQMAFDLYIAMGPLKQDVGLVCHPGQRCDTTELLKSYNFKYPNRRPQITCSVSKAGITQIQEFRFRISATGQFEGFDSRTQNCGILWPR